jgi:hypothetical protein
VVACTQEAPLFSELAEQAGSASELKFVNIREQAGWSKEGAKATPKIAALLALADLPEPEPVTAVSYKSGGELLIVGPAEAAIPWAEKLAGQLEVNVDHQQAGRRAARGALSRVVGKSEIRERLSGEFEASPGNRTIRSTGGVHALQRLHPRLP